MTIYRFLMILCLILALHACAGHSHAVSESAAKRDGVNFPQPSSQFEEYREQVLEYLLKYSLPNRTEAEIKLNLPFELFAYEAVQYRGKFLLFHGLSDSTYVWRDMAFELAKRGFDVRAVLFSGHGSHPGHLLDISYKQWLSEARQHYLLWNTDATPMYLGGFSMGGVIATILALENRQTAGLLLFSPAYHSQLNSLLRWSWLYAWFKPWMFGGMIGEDNPVKYNSIPINSGTQYYNITAYLKGHWHDATLPMPVLLVTSMNDSVVDIRYTRTLFQQAFSSERNKLLLYSNDKNLVMYKNEIISPSIYADRRILNQSHLSVINSAHNPLFGEARKILVCNGNKYPVYSACMRATEHWYGAQHTPSPDGVAVARTTYNPDFDSILSLFDQVFMRVDAD